MSTSSSSKEVADALNALEAWAEKMKKDLEDLSAKQEMVRSVLSSAGDTLTLEWNQKVQSQLKYMYKSVEEVHRLLKNP